MDTSWNSPWKVRRDFIEYERRIYMEVMTSIWRGNFYVDSTLKIDKMSMSSPHVFYYVDSMSNWRNWFTGGSPSIIFEHFLLLDPFLN